MKRIIDIAIFVVFAIGGFWLANYVVATIPFILGLAVLLAVLYWRTRRRILACLSGVFALLVLTMPIAIAGLFLAAHQWDGINDQHATTKSEVESHVFLARTVQSTLFSGLYMSCFYTWEEEDRSWHDLNGRVYTPTEGDQYYAYKVIGFLPIDVIYDRSDKVKMAFNSFDF